MRPRQGAAAHSAVLINLFRVQLYHKATEASLWKIIHCNKTLIWLYLSSIKLKLPKTLFFSCLHFVIVSPSPRLLSAQLRPTTFFDKLLRSPAICNCWNVEQQNPGYQISSYLQHQVTKCVLLNTILTKSCNLNRGSKSRTKHKRSAKHAAGWSDQGIKAITQDPLLSGSRH